MGSKLVLMFVFCVYVLCLFRYSPIPHIVYFLPCASHVVPYDIPRAFHVTPCPLSTLSRIRAVRSVPDKVVQRRLRTAVRVQHVQPPGTVLRLAVRQLQLLTPDTNAA